ncbi:ribonuclease domain-containing protein [Nocardia asteroides]|uniref:ribonuclease domain-containing protein n=1 Tax=Nocardia asteroides TaxID=1824 RepID=UPI001E541FA7|nr:ribonuclease domain-containing protein [Nocardia asteroides]UGT53615.1 ribonuclease [Nocardia asteroides]
MNLSRKTLGLLGGLVLIVLAVGFTLFTGRGENTAATTTKPVAGITTSKTAPKPGPPAGNSSAATTGAAPVTKVAGVPDRAYATLVEIDAGRWPDSANAPGTKGGEQWMNRGTKLPPKDSAGKPVTYQEWDVNPKQRNRGRDAERIVTGSDGTAWYTGDHYETFTRMR